MALITLSPSNNSVDAVLTVDAFAGYVFPRIVCQHRRDTRVYSHLRAGAEEASALKNSAVFVGRREKYFRRPAAAALPDPEENSRLLV